MNPSTLTYAGYLKVHELLTLQQPLSSDPETGRPEHDEMLFIVTHQVYELWFRQQLHEADRLMDRLVAGDSVLASTTLKRMLSILKTMVLQIDVLETMTPIDFHSFRSFLSSASGFQSAQFREFEFVLGNKNPRMLSFQPEGSPERSALERRFAAPTLYDAFVRFVAARGHAVPTELLSRDVTQPMQEWPAFQGTILDLYHHHAAERGICELLVDLDEGIQEWRYRHVKMVERTIGFKQGTGGSSGAAYLRTTLFNPLFPDLWAIRTRL
ncbi:MAG: tryptophan 2,3-dioxygenase [Planctomycetes bacterium]|nr:tryptophan 2,3-dioxygenase [Planctomycetota bacterium]